MSGPGMGATPHGPQGRRAVLRKIPRAFPNRRGRLSGARIAGSHPTDCLLARAVLTKAHSILTTAMKPFRRLLAVLLAALTTASPLAAAAGRDTPLAPAIAAHGGLAPWKTFGTLEYDLAITFGGRSTADHQRFDLINRNGLVTSPDYALGYDGTDFWTDAPAGGGPLMPPRFYLWTPFYFFAIPFVFADEGAIQTPLPAADYEGKTYVVVKITYAAGVGDAPDDYYIAYLDPATQRVKLVRYIVTYFAKEKGEPITDLPESVIVYDTWQTVSGLSLPRDATFYHWKNGATHGEPKGRMTFANVRLYTARPQPAVFARPASAKP